MDARLEGQPVLQELLAKLKRRLNIEDDIQDAVLIDVLEDTISHFMSLAGTDSFTDTRYGYIILDVADVRYNRRGSGGIRSESVDGYTVNYQGVLEDFTPYLAIIRRDFYQDGVSKGGVKFI